SMRYPLVDGQGNFGSVDGDAPAAMRYTEVRMDRIAQEMLEDIEKNTVDFMPNYDGSLEEPMVLPTRIPNLLVNGSSGIAVGMATNIPPHNLREVVDGLVLLLERPETPVDILMKVIKGPDFPTAGIICGRKGIEDAYRNGRGLVQIQGQTTIEPLKGGRESIIITELPYQVNKARLIERIAELVREKKIDGITDIRDESDREGMRVVIELRRDEQANVVLNHLYKHTNLQTTFGIIMLALVDNQPQILNLKGLLNHFIEFRKEVIIRRTQFELAKAQERAHLLEGLKIALDHLDAVIELIRRAESPARAKEELQRAFSLSEAQSQGILEMRLQRLTGLERDKILEDLRATLALVEELKGILESEERVKEIIRKELFELKEEYGDERLTEIRAEEAVEMVSEDLIAEEAVVITITRSGYIKRTPLSLYRSQRRGGKGARAIDMKEEDIVFRMVRASTHDYLLFFTHIGKVHCMKAYEIPEASRQARGKSLANLLELQEGEEVTAILNVPSFSEDKYLLMVTRKGIIKRSPLSAYGNMRAGGVIAINLDLGDSLVDVKPSEGNGTILLATLQGKAIRFPEEEVRNIGRVGRGVIGIDLRKADEVVSAEILGDGEEEFTLLTVCERGCGKRTRLSEYRAQSRGGMGLINIKVTEKNGKVVAARRVSEEEGIILVTSEGKSIRLKVDEVPIIGRNTQGFKLIGLDEGDRVVSVTLVGQEEEPRDASSM
ncbi:MAG: DNA gyrase subunit A, partial [Candidatus Tectomicrobia bacterium]|nr:DNA gyrase subunit A [Candidatus Tectomicrobia bacterium]